MARIVPVILCGGSGTRLWPISRQSFPKQFHDIGGGHTLVQETARRALAISHGADFLSVTHDSLSEVLSSQLDAMALSARHHMLLEPSARNTAAAIAFAALYVERHLDGGILWALPSDHVINNEVALAKALATAVATARTGRLVTFGIRPDRPEPGLGYIRTGAPLKQIDAAHQVDRFVEKPSLELATEYVASGDYLWNSGMFVMDAGTFLAALRRHAPEIEVATRKAFETVAIDQNVCRLEAAAYGAIPSAPVDKAVMEKERDIAVVPCDLGWSDVGSWQSLWDISPKDADGNVSAGDVLISGATNSYFRSERRLVAAAGVDNLVVIETADAVLVAGLDAHQPIRDLAAVMQQQSRSETQNPLRQEFSWGALERLKDDPGYTLDELVLKPLGTLKVPHEWCERPTQWTVAAGTASITVDGQAHQLTGGDSVAVTTGQQIEIAAGPQAVTLFVLSYSPAAQG